jgi:hypothetical protein
VAKTIKIIIKADSFKVAIGHQSHLTGTGAHSDKRTKRNRTRGDRKRSAISEW